MIRENICPKSKVDMQVKKHIGLTRKLHLQEVSSELCSDERKCRKGQVGGGTVCTKTRGGNELVTMKSQRNKKNNNKVYYIFSSVEVKAYKHLSKALRA